MSLAAALELTRLLRGGAPDDTFGYDPLVQVGTEQRVGTTAFADRLRELGVVAVRSVTALPAQAPFASDAPLWATALATRTADGLGPGWHAVPGPLRTGGDGRKYAAPLWLPLPPLEPVAGDGAALVAAARELDAALRSALQALDGRQAARTVRAALLALHGTDLGNTLRRELPGPPVLSRLLSVVDSDLVQVLLNQPGEALGRPATAHARYAGDGRLLERAHRAGLALRQQAAALVEDAADGMPVGLPDLPPWAPVPPAGAGEPAPLASADAEVRAVAAALDAALARALDVLAAGPVPPPSTASTAEPAGPRWRRRHRTPAVSRSDDPQRLAQALAGLTARFTQARRVLAGDEPAPWWDVADPTEAEGGTTATRLHAAGQIVQDVADRSSRGPAPYPVGVADLDVLLGPAWPALTRAADAVEPLSRPLHRAALPSYRPPASPAWWMRRA